MFEAKAPIKEEKSSIGEENSSIGEEKPSIDFRKEAFLKKIQNINGYSTSLNNLVMLFEALCDCDYFSRRDIMTVCSIQVSSAGDLLDKLKESNTIVPVEGHGKGKYRFVV